MIGSMTGRLKRFAAALSEHLSSYLGQLGVVEPDAFAGLLVVAANPLDDVSVLFDTGNMVLIVKDSRIYKNEL